MKRRARAVAVAALVVAVALAVRIPLFGFQTGDFTGYVKVWYFYIAQHGGFAALGGHFSDYNEPYLYLVAALSYLPVSPLVGVKVISVCFDLASAYFGYRITRLRYPKGVAPVCAAVALLLLPTVVVNSSLWGQADALYAAPCLAAVNYLLRRRGWLACGAVGLALSFKLQAVFIVPVLLLAVLKRYIPWRALAMVPVVVGMMY